MRRNSPARARCSLSLAAALGVACSSNDDVVARAVAPLPALSVVLPISGSSSVSGGAIGSGEATIADGAPGTQAAPAAAGTPGTQAVPPAVGAPSTQAAPPAVGASTRNLTTGVGTAASTATLLVSGSPRSSTDDDAERWPFSSPLRVVFGSPELHQVVWYRVLDPGVADVLRQLGSSHGFTPGGAATFAVDDRVDQYDLSLQEYE